MKLFFLVTSDRQYSFTLAKQSSSTWSLDSNNAVLTYTDGVKTVSITMICSSADQDEFEVLGEDFVNHYSMRLRSRCACWGGCVGPRPATTTSSTFLFFLLNVFNKNLYFSIL